MWKAIAVVLALSLGACVPYEPYDYGTGFDPNAAAMIWMLQSSQMADDIAAARVMPSNGISQQCWSNPYGTYTYCQ